MGENKNLFISKNLRQVITALLFLTPFFVVYVTFTFVPIIQGAILSFHNVKLGSQTFIGFSNYVELISDQRFWTALRNVTLYSSLNGLGFIISIGIGLFINAKIISSQKLKTILQAPLFIPMVITWVTLGINWRLLSGLILPDFFKYLNQSLGADIFPAFNLISQTSTAPWMVGLITIWASVGYNSLLFLAGYRLIPLEYFEAATIDGASRWTVFRKITLPLMKPMLLFMLVTTLVGSVNIFDPIQATTQGGPAWSTISLTQYAVATVVQFYRPGYGAAIGLMVFAIIFILSVIQFKIVSKVMS